MKPQKVALAVADSDVQSVHRMIHDLAAALTAKGIATRLFDSRAKAEWAALASAGVDTVICYGGGIGHALEMSAYLHGLTVLLVSLDHPVYWLDTFLSFRKAHCGRSVFAFPTVSNLNLAAHWLGAEDVHCLRHSSNSVPSVLPMDQRRHAIILVGNYTPPGAAREAVMRQAMPLLSGFDAAVQRLQNGRGLCLEDAVAPCFPDPFGADKDAFIWLSIMVDRFMRSQMRQQAVAALAGLPVTVVGAGWDGAALPKSFTSLGPRPSQEVLDLIASAKIVVNTTPHYYESHERMFDAAAAGAIVCTAKTAYTEERFAPCGLLFDQVSEIGGMCRKLLSNPDVLDRMGQSAARMIENGESWPYRVDRILAVLDDGADGTDLVVDFKNTTDTLNLSIARLSDAHRVLLSIWPQQHVAAVQFFAQAGRFLPSDAVITVVIAQDVPLSGFFQMAQVLEVNGYLTVEVKHGSGWGRLTVRKSAELRGAELGCSFTAEGRNFILTYPSARDVLRRFAVHGKTFYELSLLQRFGQIQKAGMLVDVGANIGNHSIYAAAVLGRFVVAYEPNPETFACLRANIRSNCLTDKIESRGTGVGLAAGWAELSSVDPANSGATQLRTSIQGAIQIVRLDDEWLSFNEPVAILKIDVEGMELDVLRGAVNLIKQCQPIVFAETWSDEVTRSLSELMACMSYACHGKVEGTEMLEFRPDHI